MITWWAAHYKVNTKNVVKAENKRTAVSERLTLAKELGKQAAIQSHRLSNENYWCEHLFFEACFQGQKYAIM